MKNLKIGKANHTFQFPSLKDYNLVRLFIFIAISILILNLLLFFYSLRTQIVLKVGEPAPQDVIVPATITYIDEEKTELEKQKVKENISPLYKLDPNIQLEVINDVEDFFAEAKQIISKNISYNEKINDLTNLLGISSDEAKTILSISLERLNSLKNYLVNELNKLYLIGIRVDNFQKTKAVLETELKNSPFSNSEEQLLLSIVEKFLKPNLVIDEDATNKLVQEATKNVKPVEIVLQEGTKIIEKGHIITQADIDLLEKIGIYKKINAFKILFIILLSILQASILLLVLFKKKHLIKKALELLLILSFSLITAVVLKSSVYLLPLPLFMWVMIEFFNFQDVFLSSIVFLLTFLFIGSQTVFLPFLIFSISILITFFLAKVKRLSTYFVITSVGAFWSFLLVLLLNKSTTLSFLNSFNNSATILINFLLSSALALAVVYILEHIFNEATFLRLIELSDANTALLKEMSEKAPGTYNHSLAVANLSSQAAEAINANSLLTRVGALYHDIGKLLYPYYFTENQAGIPNIHNTISPSLSKVIIVNHVKDGIDLAKKYHLPDEIIHFIETHHGKSIMLYFYRKAKELDPNVLPDDYRYPGPLPDSKETVIVSLADAVEAASHSLKSEDIDYRKLEELVNRIVEERIKEGELSSANITFEELEKIKQSFVKTLISIYHKRERYPDEKQRNSGNS